MYASAFYIYLWVMIALAVVVFVALYFVEAGYGMMISPKWGKAINNKIAWFLMEFPIFLAMLILWFFSPHRMEATSIVFLRAIMIMALQQHNGHGHRSGSSQATRQFSFCARLLFGSVFHL